MRVCVVGGGNIGTLLAADAARAGNEVIVCTSEPELWNGRLEVYGSDGERLYTAEIAEVTTDVSGSVCKADIVWVTYPVYLLPSLAEKLVPSAHEGQLIGVTPGALAEYYLGSVVEHGATLFGLQRVHSIARLKVRGRSVVQLGRKGELQVAALPPERSIDVAQVVEAMLGIPTIVLPNYLVESLTPSNPILHTARIRTMFEAWEPGKTFDHNILFYQEWDLTSSKRMMACDAEVQTICASLSEFDLSGVKPLTVHYQSSTPEAMTAKISSIPAFKGLTSPMKRVEGGWVPDFSNRYFRADFAYGLKAIQDIAGLCGVDTPNINEILFWYFDVSGNKDFFKAAPATRQELVSLYE